MEVTRVEQRAYIKIAVFRGENSPCDFDLIPKFKEPKRCRRFATREDIANAVRQQDYLLPQHTHFWHDFEITPNWYVAARLMFAALRG
ncbi:hypothetical protein TNCV_3299841 [Trichonephila clavipes]|nr:hypothetical protein TNCV_3299841 [Trichonephila clavipes]